MTSGKPQEAVPQPPDPTSGKRGPVLPVPKPGDLVDRDGRVWTPTGTFVLEHEGEQWPADEVARNWGPLRQWASRSEDIPDEVKAAVRRAVEAGYARLYISGGTERIEFTTAGLVAWCRDETSSGPVAEQEQITRDACQAASQINRYRPKIYEVEARQLLDDSDWDEIAAWCGAEPHPHFPGDLKDQMPVPTSHGMAITWTCIGWWIVKVGDGFKVMEPADFEAAYEPIPGGLPAWHKEELAAAGQPTEEAATGLHTAIQAVLTACLAGEVLPLVELAVAYEAATGWTVGEPT